MKSLEVEEPAEIRRDRDRGYLILGYFIVGYLIVKSLF